MRHAKSVWQRPLLVWEPCEPTAHELSAAENEATKQSEFDTLALKSQVWTAYKEGKARLVCRKLGSLARVVAFLPEGVEEPSWEFWSRIFLWFGPSKDGRPWSVTWFAATTPRMFPLAGTDLGPEHVNGGYTSVCSTAGIFIYRKEEASRVLIHEMMHAACLDEVGPKWDIPNREGMVEMWAELILIALKSRGNVLNARRLWTKQSHWISDTNWKAKMENGQHDSTDYAWRYLACREQMYAMHGIALPAPRKTNIQSLRFTHPALET